MPIKRLKQFLKMFLVRTQASKEYVFVGFFKKLYKTKLNKNQKSPQPLYSK